MHTDPTRLLRACLPALVVLGGLCLLPGRAVAQCTEEPCGPVDTTPPVITFSPASGTFPAGAQTVTITWSDNYVLNHNSRWITYGTQNVTNQFTYSTSNGGTAQSTGQVEVGTGASTLTAYICDASSYGPNCATQAVTFTGPPPPPASASIAPETPTAVVAGGSGGALRYRVTNTGAAPGTFSMSTDCAVGFAPCAPSDSSVTLAAGASAWVDVSFATPASGAGLVRLTTLGGSVAGATTVTVPATAGAGYPGDSLSLLRIQRDACVVVATGPGTASECGDLRVAHALPSVRVLNRERTPVLTYNSDHAWPNPVVAAQFAGPPGTVPDSIRAVLLVNGTQVAQRRWRGWGAGQARRIALSFAATDPVAYRTGVYSYSLVVTAEWLDGTQAPVGQASRSGRMIIVNRSSSPFGAGWWLSGVEQVTSLSDTEKLWVGGDGSARLYHGTSAAGPWTADAYDRVNVLKAGPGGVGYVRELPGGARVHFDGTGHHARTENALGHVTQFVWVSGGSPAEKRLQSLILPSAPGHPETLSYQFEYGTTGPGCTTTTPALSRVRSPAADGGFRDSWLCGDALRRVTRMGDATPDTTFVTFGYYLSTKWMTRRTDRRGVAQTMGYSRVRFHNTVQPLSAGVNATTTVAATQTLGMNGVSVNADSVQVVYDGPRLGSDVCDCLWWNVDRWGAPTSLRNSLGHVTAVRRGDGRFPGLVTETVAPNGFRSTAAYDALGYLASTTAWNPYGDGRNATTILEWDSAAAAPVRIVSPEGEVSTMGYDAMRRRAWEQVGPDSVRRVRYQYHGASHTTAPGLVRAVIAPGGARDSVEYDTRGNLAASVGPSFARTEYLSDRLGRGLRTRVAIDSAHTQWQQDSTVYDPSGRVHETIATGPAMNGVPRQWLHVRTHYDREDNVEMVERWSAPDVADVDTIRTRWEYDLAGRPIVEIAPDGARDSTFYDRAGNVVRVRTRRFAESRAAVETDSAAHIWMRYDALNRLTRRILPPVRYEPRLTKIGTEFQNYPMYPTGGLGHLIPADMADFAYDPVTGLQSRADNAHAQVRRWYYPNGQLKHDSLFVREVETASFASHRYGLEYRYDRAGRVIELLHPSQLRPPLAAAAGQTGNRFGYDPATGALAWVTDPMGNAFRYHYNVRGEPDSLVLPGRITHRYVYDGGGQLTGHQIYNQATGGSRYDSSWLRRESLRYDRRGRLIRAENQDGLADILTVDYSGLGHATQSNHSYRGRYTPTDQAARHVAAEASSHDALGNVYRLVRTGLTNVYGQGFWEKSQNTYESVEQLFDFQKGSGRQMERDAGNVVELNHFDAGGNITYSQEAPSSTQQPGQRQDRVSYYDGGGRLWAVDLRHGDNGNARTTPLYYTYEEYRLDALGRRVLVRARKSCEYHPLGEDFCPALSSVRRTVWAGDRELYEIQMPDTDGENDTADVPAQQRFETFDPNPFWGRVAYTYGGAIDQPLSIVRVGYKDYHDATTGTQAWPEFAIIPHWNAHGQAQTGTFDDGTAERCRSGYPEWCVKLEWADGLFPYNPGPRVPEHWHGTLLGQKRDASGLMYRRNRYYDPSTGRFTQEDPIGLAGGVNVYGFANGDPVSYADPYGLSPCRLPDLDIWECARQGGLAMVENSFEGLRRVGGVFGFTDVGEVAAGISTDNGQRIGAGGRIMTAGLILVGVAIPEGRIAANIRRTVRSAQTDVTVSRMGRFYRASWEVPGRDRGESRAVWNKIINEEGETVRTYKDSYDRAGRFVHRKFKFPDHHLSR